MPTTTYQVASFANGLVRGEIDHDNNNFRVRKARVINDSDYPAVVIVKKAGVVVVEQIIPAHDTVQKNLPASIKIFYDEGDPVWGYPPSLTMGDINIGMRYPA